MISDLSGQCTYCPFTAEVLSRKEFVDRKFLVKTGLGPIKRYYLLTSTGTMFKVSPLTLSYIILQLKQGATNHLFEFFKSLSRLFGNQEIRPSKYFLQALKIRLG